MLCADKGLMVQSTVLFRMDWIMVWHACLIPWFRDDHDDQPELCEFIIFFKYLLLIDLYVCKSDTSGNRLKVPFAVMRHKYTNKNIQHRGLTDFEKATQLDTSWPSPLAMME